MGERSPQELTRIVGQWLAIAYREEIGGPAVHPPTPADAEHSALLARLFEGKPALPEPPPRAFSYPWYELVDVGTARGYLDLHVHDNDDMVSICQSAWRLVDKVNAREMVVEWPATRLRCLLEITDPQDGMTLGEEGRMTVLPPPLEASSADSPQAQT